MTPRRAFIFIALSATIASLFLIANVLISRCSEQPERQSVRVALSGLAMPLNANGSGAQNFDGNILSYHIDPYPVRAGEVTTLTLVALSSQTQQPITTTPTFMVTANDMIDGARFEMKRERETYVARDVFFPDRGVWRVRVSVPIIPNNPYITHILIEANR
jgi:hypothetical protein